MENKPLIYRGSVKDIYKDEPSGHYIFQFSDRYSIFDWGEMPDLISNKGEALAFMANSFFEALGNDGNFSHHGVGRVDEKGEPLLDGEVSRNFAVNPVEIIHPEYRKEANEWDYEAFVGLPTKCLVPLEVIFRLGVPEGSSILKRAADLDYCKAIGLEKSPQAGDVFKSVIIEFSTKLENYDRYIDYAEAQRISHMNDSEFKDLIDRTKKSANKLNDFLKEMDVTLWDGKFEFAFGEELNGKRDLVMVDSIGPDELRLTYKGVQLSKEVLRKFYRGSEWERNVKRAKQISEERGEKDWKSICINELKSNPTKLEDDKIQSVSEMYKAISNALSMKLYGKEVFKNTWSLDRIVEVLR